MTTGSATAASDQVNVEQTDVLVVGAGMAGLCAAIGGTHDVLICDIGLPELDGLTLVKRLREEKGDASMPFSIALSGYGQDEDSVSALDAGFDVYLVKPVEPQALLACIASIACQERARGARA